MPEGAAIDTDVLLKAAAYRMAEELVAVLERHGTPATLGLTHLIAGGQLAKKRNVRDAAGAGQELERLLAALGQLEPDDDEIALAAELAGRAQTQSLPLDSGEAQLAAITMRRGLALLVTGDKRAIAALHSVLTDAAERGALAGRLACFEQVVATVSTLVGELETRARICAEPDVDGAMRLACSCGNDQWDSAQLREACDSFIDALRAGSGDLLADGSLLA